MLNPILNEAYNSVLSEAQRLEYLRAFGVVQYVPTFPLPDALPSEILPEDPVPEFAEPEPARPQGFAASIPVESERPPPQEPVVARTQTPEPERQRPDDRLSSEGVSVTLALDNYRQDTHSGPGGNATATNGKSSATTPSGAPSGLPRFVLASVPIAPSVIWVGELGDHEVAELSADEYQLLHNITAALRLPGLSVSPDYFRWPLVDNPRIPQGVDIATESFAQFMGTRLASGRPTLIASGTWVQQLLGVAESAALSGDHSVGGKAIHVIKVPAFAQMFQQWQAKQHTWNAIAHLTVADT